jgi:HxlR-like helix-turn-helix
VPYQERPVRYDYLLTAKGRDLWHVVTAMRQWGDRWAAPAGPPTQIVHDECGAVTTVVPTCSSCGGELSSLNVTVVRGPGRRSPDPLADALPAAGAPVS